MVVSEWGVDLRVGVGLLALWWPWLKVTTR